MYKIKTTNGSVAYADDLVWIRALPNGNYTPVSEKDADGFCAKIIAAVTMEDGMQQQVLKDTVFSLPEHVLTGVEPEAEFEIVSAALMMQRAEAEKTAAQHTAATLMGMPVYTAVTESKAQSLRAAIVTAAASLPDKDASEAPELFPQLTGGGSLVKAGTRICWQGGIKRAAVDLWDTAENTPDAAPNLWEDIQYKQGYRLIPETITATLAFAKGERGWWQDELYESLLAANVYTPSVNPDGWKKITEEGA